MCEVERLEQYLVEAARRPRLADHRRHRQQQRLRRRGRRRLVPEGDTRRLGGGRHELGQLVDEQPGELAAGRRRRRSDQHQRRGAVDIAGGRATVPGGARAMGRLREPEAQIGPAESLRLPPCDAEPHQRLAHPLQAHQPGLGDERIVAHERRVVTRCGELVGVGGDEPRQRHEAGPEQRPQALLDGGEVVAGRARGGFARGGSGGRVRVRPAAARTDASSAVAGTAASPRPNPHDATQRAVDGCGVGAGQPGIERGDRRLHERPGSGRALAQLCDVDAGLGIGVGWLQHRAVERAGAGDERRERPAEFEQIEDVAVGAQRRSARRFRDRPRRARGQFGDARLAGTGDADEVGGREREVGERHRVLRGVVGHEGELAPGHRAEAAGQPRVERRLADGPRRGGRRRPAPRRRGIDGEHDGDAMGDRDPGARRADEVEIRRRGEPAIDVAERVDRRGQVAPHEVMDLLGLQQIGGRVDSHPEAAQHPGSLAPQRLVLRAVDEVVDGVAFAVGPQLVEREPVEPARSDRQQLLPRQRRDLAGVVDRGVEAPLVQVALDEIAEHGAEAAAGSHAVEDALRQSHALRRDRDGKRVVVAATVGEVSVAQQRRDLGLVDRRGVQESRVVDRPVQRHRFTVDRFGDRVALRRRKPLDPAVPADQHPGGLRGPQLGEAAGRQRRGPRVHPVGGGIERVGDTRCEHVGTRIGDSEHGGTERLDAGGRRIGGRRQPGPHGGVADRRLRRADQPSVEPANPKSSASWAGATVTSAISLVAASACSRSQPCRTNAANSEAGRSSTAAATASTSATSRSRRAAAWSSPTSGSSIGQAVGS